MDFIGISCEVHVFLSWLEIRSWFPRNDCPHITLGTAARVNPVVSNELLARRAAAEDLQRGLPAWLQQLGLAPYAGALAAWCQQMGAASPEELAEFGQEAAAAVETDQKAQEHIVEVLQKAVERPIHTVMCLGFGGLRA